MFLVILVRAGQSLCEAQGVPPGVTDPGRSVWFQVGETNDVVMGLTYTPNRDFPAPRTSVAGVPAMLLLNPPGGGFYAFFLEVANWFTATNVALNIEYFDSATGVVAVLYDSFDETIR